MLDMGANGLFPVLCQHQANLLNMVSSDTSSARNLFTNENNIETH